MAVQEQIQKALDALGVKGDMTLTDEGHKDRYTVCIDGEYFGIYDLNRDTFVD